MGSLASATGSTATAVGMQASASGNESLAIGTNAQATLQGAVALGSGSTTATGATNQGSTKINGITYNFAGATGNPNMQVSVGSAAATAHPAFPAPNIAIFILFPPHSDLSYM